MHVPLAIFPLANPLLLLTWHPPVVTGIVHLGPRLSVNCPPLFPIAPFCPPFQNPNPFSDFPEPNVHLIKARLNPLPSIQNKCHEVFVLFFLYLSIPSWYLIQNLKYSNLMFCWPLYITAASTKEFELGEIPDKVVIGLR